MLRIVILNPSAVRFLSQSKGRAGSVKNLAALHCRIALLVFQAPKLGAIYGCAGSFAPP